MNYHESKGSIQGPAVEGGTKAKLVRADVVPPPPRDIEGSKGDQFCNNQMLMITWEQSLGQSGSWK